MDYRRLLALILVSALLVATNPQARAGAAPQALTPKERREIATAVTAYRRAEDDAARSSAVDGVLALGAPGAAALLDAASAQLEPLQARYRAAFLTAARAVLRERLKEHDSAELDSLQDKIASLRNDGGLTKESIKTKGDPALAELEKILILAPDEIRQANADLQKQRDALLAFGRHRDKALAYLTEHLPKAQALSDTRPYDEVLADHEALTALLAVAKSDSHRRILIENADAGRTIQPEEARGIQRLNQIRILAGLKPLRIDVKLCEAGRDHSKDMVEKKFFAHDSPVPGKKTPWDRAKRFGTTAHAENIAAGASTGAGSIQQWWYSPGHHTNMMGNHSRVGLGRYGKTWTQMFG